MAGGRRKGQKNLKPVYGKRAMYMYTHEKKTLAQIAEELSIDIRTLNNWSTVDNWVEERARAADDEFNFEPVKASLIKLIGKAIEVSLGDIESTENMSPVLADFIKSAMPYMLKKQGQVQEEKKKKKSSTPISIKKAMGL